MVRPVTHPSSFYPDSLDALGIVFMEVRAEANRVTVFLLSMEIEIIPDTRFRMMGDLVINSPPQLKTEKGLKSGINDIQVSLDLNFPEGSGFVELRSGPMEVIARPLDVGGDGIPELLQLVKGVNYYGLFATLAFVSLASVTIVDVPVQKHLDRKRNQKSTFTRRPKGFCWTSCWR